MISLKTEEGESSLLADDEGVRGYAALGPISVM